ncbi:TonB-dependent receptor [Paludibaculum fermentans]|uniref:TonB-dependent receptor n=1 Tax=Paludibaculum fermentans TaxID=1473598 RepID=A0A7S7NT77_PALFE|nr:carboxypeptidase regulatory-like domain-containing protein [Paludibaculum fermentans]QOY89388.1 TonB-dependent receptor [Paludibaculum fermentans]
MPRLRRIPSWLCLALGALVSAPSALPQSSMATVIGSVADTSAAILPGARVTLSSLDGGQTSTAVVNESGLFTLLNLNPGRYRLTAEAKGFKTHTRPEVVLETGAKLRMDLVLQVGDAAESITVSESTPLLQTATSSLNAVVENKTVVNMPLASRRMGSLVRLLPGVTFGSEDTQEGAVNFTIAGGRSRQQMWTLDGGVIQGNAMLTGILEFNPPVEALQEFRVEALGYPAEYGRSMGGFIAMTTKSGTNNYHGVAYHYLRNDAFDARNFFSPYVAPRKYNVFGGTLGGPIRKDKTHFFASYEGTRRRDGVTRIYNVPTAAELQGDFSARSGTLLDPLTKTPFPGKIVPVSRMDPVGSALSKLYPAANVAGRGSGDNNFLANVVNTNSAHSLVTRIDHQLTAKDRLSGRYVQYISSTAGGSATPVFSADPNAITNTLNIANISPAWFHEYTPSMFQETRFVASLRGADVPKYQPDAITGQVGLKGVPATGMPQVNVTGYSSLGTGNQFRALRPQYTFQASNSISWFHGTHTVKFGGEYRYTRNVEDWGTARFGIFGFNDIATGAGFGMASLLLGWTNSTSIENGATDTRTDYYGFFVQDDWKISKRLTLNYGLRYDLDTPRWERQNRQSGFDPYGLNPVSNTLGTITYSGVNGLSKYAHPFDRNNFGPRFGLAYRAPREIVVRMGYGLMYGGIYDASLGRALNVGFGDVRSYSSSDNGFTPVFQLKDGVPAPVQEPLTPGYGAVPVGQRVRVSPDFLAQDHRNPYSHQVTFTLQKQIFGNFLVEGGYGANLAHRIAAPGVNINEVRPELRGVRQDQTLRPFPQYNGVTLRSANWGNSSYHALNLKAEKRFSAGLNLLATYTFSKFLDDVKANSEAGGTPTNGIQTVYERALDKAISGNDARNRFTTSLVYELPVGKGRKLDLSNRIADAVAGGWTLGTITELRSGLPYGVVENTNRLNAFSSVQRPNLVSNPVLDPGRSRADLVSRWFDTNAFVFPGDGKLGNAPRNVAAGPGFANVELSMLKDFHFTEQRFLQLRGEFFNVLNRPNFALPNGNRGAAAFGRISGTVNDGRFIQIALRLVF